MMAALIMTLAAGFACWMWVRVVRRVTGRPNHHDWIWAVAGPAALMIFVIACNALAFLKLAFVKAAVESPYGEPTMRDALIGQITVVVGSAALMWLICNAAAHPGVYEAQTHRDAGLRAQKRMIEGLLIRHWLAVIGAGTVFGIASGPGPVILLAAELTVMWVAIILGLGAGEREVRDPSQPDKTHDESVSAIDETGRGDASGHRRAA